MRELFPIFIVSMTLVILSEANSSCEIGRFGEKKYFRKDIFIYMLMTVIMAVFVGLRTGYNDTSAYIHGYEIMDCDFFSIDWSLGSNPGFKFANQCLRILGISTQNFLMFYALITVCIYLWFVRKYTNDLCFSLFLFWTAGVYTFTMAAIKQCVAVAFCLVATECFIQKKYGRFIFWVVLASTFHPYSLMYFIVPFLTFNPWTKKTYGMLLIFGVLGICLESMLGTIVNITSMLGEEYTEASFSGGGVNIFRFLVTLVPVLLAFMARKFLKENNNRESNLMMNLTMLRAEIMFVALFGTANYFARLANYFSLFQLITLPWLFQFFNNKSRKILLVCAVVCYMIYFYYAEGILYGGFDFLFKRISFLEYLKTAF